LHLFNPDSTGEKCNHKKTDHVVETNEIMTALLQYANKSKHFKTTEIFCQVMPKGGS